MFAMAVVQISGARAREAANQGSFAPGGERTDAESACRTNTDAFRSLRVPLMFNTGIIASIMICGRRPSRAQQ
jgi:hypothetical protein